jgi:hypothetical protein
MLLQDYAYYVMNLFAAGAVTPLGLLSLALIAAAVISIFALRGNRTRSTAVWGLLIAGLVCLMTTFYTAVYVFDERPETLSFETLPAGEPDCGSAWSGWIKSGYGLTNQCDKGCYRGKILHKHLRMRGLPPWPEYNREYQCWKR